MTLKELLENKQYKECMSRCASKFKKAADSFKRDAAERDDDSSDFPGKNDIVFCDIRNGRFIVETFENICENDMSEVYKRIGSFLGENILVLDRGVKYWRKNNFGRWEHSRKSTVKPDYSEQLEFLFDIRKQMSPDDKFLSMLSQKYENGEVRILQIAPLLIYGKKYIEETLNVVIEEDTVQPAILVKPLNDFTTVINQTSKESIIDKPVVPLTSVWENNKNNKKQLKENIRKQEKVVEKKEVPVVKEDTKGEREMKVKDCMDSLKAYTACVKAHAGEIAKLEEERNERTEEAKTILDMGVEESVQKYNQDLEALNVEFEKRKAKLLENKQKMEKDLADAYEKAMNNIEKETTSKIEAVKLEQNVLREKLETDAKFLHEDAQLILKMWLENFDNKGAE